MAGDKKITDLDPVSSLTGAENVETVQVGANKRFTITTLYNYFKELFDLVYATFTGNYVSGFDRTDTDTMGTPSWNDGTRTYSIAVKSGESSFWFWVKSVKKTKTTTQSVTIPDVSGTYYFYFDNDGVMQYILESAMTSIVSYQHAICGGVYWNAVEGVGLPWEERHGKNMSPATHIYNHLTVGARYGSGLNPTGFTEGDTTYTNVTSGIYWDEDIQHELALATTHNFLYRSGSDGEWVRESASNEHALKVSGDTYYSWNEWTGSTWQLTEGNYFIMFWLASPSLGGATVNKMVSQSNYNSARTARSKIDSELSRIKTAGLPSPEFVFLFATIIKRDGKLQYVDGTSTYYDLRSVKGSVAGNTTPSHNDLDGLELADTGVTYGHIDDQSQSIYGVKKFNDDLGIGITPIYRFQTYSDVTTLAAYIQNINSSGFGLAIHAGNTSSQYILALRNSSGTDRFKFFSDGTSTFVSSITGITEAITEDSTKMASTAYVKAQRKQTSVASSATPTPTGDRPENEYYLTALAAAAEFAAPSGTASNGNTLMIRIKDNGTARALTYNAIYRAIGVTLPTTTVISKTMYLGCIYNSSDSKWDVVSVIEEA